MFKHTWPVCTAALLIAMMGTATSAAVIESSAVAVNVQIDGSGGAELGSPVATTTNTQNFVGPGGFIDVATGSATQNENGFSSVEAKVTHSGFEGIGANGSLDRHTVDSLAERDITFTNTSGTTAYLGTFDFTISGGFLQTIHGGGGPIATEASIFFYAGAGAGNTFNASMTLTGEYNSHTITESTGFTGTVENFDCNFGVCLGGRVNVDTLSGSLDLGVLQPGESITVVTVIGASNVWNGTEIGAIARVRDPSGLSFTSANFTPVTTTPSPVPLPAGGVLLVSALGLGAAVKRRAARR